MSIAYQCWEMGVGPTVGCKLAHGQNHSLVGPQNVSDGSTLRRHSNPLHDTSSSNFQMYMEPQSDLKGQSLATHPKDVSAVTTVRFSSSPISSAYSPNALTLVSEACADASPKQPVISGSNVTTSSVTTEADEKVSSGSDGSMTTVGGACEAQSRRLESVPGTIAGGSLSKFPGAFLADRGLRVKMSTSKPGVVEHIVPLNGGSSHGGYVYGSANKNALAEHSPESSSSICQASEDSGSCSSDTGGEEAQSAYRGPLTKMSALDASLPIKRPGLSKFFGGKSRSFSSLAEVSTVTELAKPNNPYAKRRKMGFNCPLDKNRSYPPPTRSSGASIAKKLPSSGSRSTLAVAVILGDFRKNIKSSRRLYQVPCETLKRGHFHPAHSRSPIYLMQAVLHHLDEHAEDLDNGLQHRDFLH